MNSIKDLIKKDENLVPHKINKNRHKLWFWEKYDKMAG